MQRHEWAIDVSLEAFIYSLVKNSGANAKVECRRRKARYAALVQETEAGDHAWMNPEQALEEAEQEAFYERTLAQLPAVCRRAHAMVREQHVTYQEAADRLGVSRSTLCAHLVTVRRHFRARLRSQGIDLVHTGGRLHRRIARGARVSTRLGRRDQAPIVAAMAPWRLFASVGTVGPRH
jgi:DNA-directed RNA polymerase specialized sigma24 family protein